ncbi:hypothetical protein HN011_000907, partial [Eciton burchellii]
VDLRSTILALEDLVLWLGATKTRLEQSGHKGLVPAMYLLSSLLLDSSSTLMCLISRRFHETAFSTSTVRCLKQTLPRSQENEVITDDDSRCVSRAITTTFDSILLKTDDDITRAVESFNNAVQQAVWNATPTSSNPDINIECSIRNKSRTITAKNVAPHVM